MPVFENPNDRDESVQARAAQDDPWVMYLVVRRERPVAAEDLLGAVARASVAVVERYAADPAHAEAFARWFARSFRKVCLRATEKEWAKLDALPGAAGAAGGEDVVRALPPVRKSQRDRLLVKLQAYTPDVATLPPPVARALDPAPTLALVVSSAPMRAGKLVAQASHAVLLCAQAFGASDAAAFAQWTAAGRPCAARVADAAAWAALKASARCAVVRDAGLTEVAAGTETVLALPPAPPAAWPPALAALRALGT